MAHGKPLKIYTLALIDLLKGWNLDRFITLFRELCQNLGDIGNPPKLSRIDIYIHNFWPNCPKITSTAKNLNSYFCLFIFWIIEIQNFNKYSLSISLLRTLPQQIFIKYEENWFCNVHVGIKIYDWNCGAD